MMSSMKLFSYPGRMYSISVFVKSNFPSVLQRQWSPSCPQGGILFSCADTFLQEILKPNHTHTGPLLEEFKAWRENKPVLGLESELQCMLNCVFTFFVFTSWAVDQYRRFLNTGSTVRGQPFILWPCQSGKKTQTTRKKYLPIQHLLVSAMCETDMESGNCCHESELAAVWGSGGESHTSGGKRSHRCMITLPCIPFFPLTQGRAMRKIKFCFIHGWSQMLASTLAAGGRNRTTDTETWLKLSKSDPHLGLGFSPETELLLGQSLSELVLYSSALFFCLFNTFLSHTHTHTIFIYWTFIYQDFFL